MTKLHRQTTWPECDSDPGMLPNPPSKFMQERMNSTAFGTFAASNWPSKARHAKAQKEKRVSTSPEEIEKTIQSWFL